MRFPRLLVSLLLIVLSTFFAGCRGAADTPALPEIGAHSLVMAPEDEPGQRLVLTGTVVDAKTGIPIPGALVYLYHADANGEYRPADPAEESTAWLSGEVTTGEEGQFNVQTIVPREYDVPGNRHIHLHYVRAAGYAENGGVILFEDDVNPEIRQWANDTGFGIIIELEEVDGVQHGSVTIPLTPEGQE